MATVRLWYHYCHYFRGLEAELLAMQKQRARAQIGFWALAWAFGRTSQSAHAHQSPRRFIGVARQHQVQSKTSGEYPNGLKLCVCMLCDNLL
jgi:hypothetical protein